MANPSFEALAASSGNKAHVWQPFSQEPDLNYFSVVSEGKIYCVQWNQNNKVIVSGGQTGIVTLNYNRDGALMGTLPKNTPTQADRLSAISSIAFSKGSKLLAAGCTDSSVRVWDLKQQTCKYFLDSHKAAVTYVTFSPDDQQLASACLTGEIHLHTVRQTSQAAVLRTPGNRAKRSLHFTALEPLLTTGAEDGSLYVWDTSTFTLLDSYIQMHSATVSRVCFSPGSPNILISAGLDKSIILTDRRLDAAIAKVQGALPLTALDCKDNGNCITVGTTSGSVHLYDPRKLESAFMELSCSDGEPVSSLHWQQSGPPARGGAKAKATPRGPGLASPASTAASTPGAPHSALRTQEFLSAASPGTPMVPPSRAEVEARAPPPGRTVSDGSQQSQSTSDASLSFPTIAREDTHQRSTLAAFRPQNGASRGVPGDSPAMHLNGQRSVHEVVDPSGLQSRAALPASAGHYTSRDHATATPADRYSSREEAQPISAVDEEEAAGHTYGGHSARSDVYSRGGRPAAAPPDVGHNNPALDDQVPLEEADRGSGPTAAAASFGVRLKRLLATQTGESTLDGMPAGNGVVESGRRSGQLESRSTGGEPRESVAQAAEDIKAAISSDIKTLHFEMIRQFHIQQVEMRELVETVAKRQDGLAQELAMLRSQVQQLATRQQAPHALFD